MNDIMFAAPAEEGDIPLACWLTIFSSQGSARIVGKRCCPKVDVIELGSLILTYCRWPNVPAPSPIYAHYREEVTCPFSVLFYEVPCNITYQIAVRGVGLPDPSPARELKRGRHNMHMTSAHREDNIA